MADALSVSFLGALQASLAVLLTISYGVIAAQFNLLKGNSTKQISTVCVRMFLPALLITNVGSQLHSETAIRYVPILSRLCSLRVETNTRSIWIPTWLIQSNSMESHLHPLLHVAGLSCNSSLESSLVDHSCNLLQQYHVSPSAPDPIPQFYRYPRQTSHVRRRYHF